MNTESTGPQLDQRLAEQIARSFGVVYNSAALYGAIHPTTLKNCEPFFTLLQKAFDTVPALSFIVDRDSLFLEEFCIDKLINTKRVVARLQRSGIESLTFERGLGPGDLQKIISVTGDMKLVRTLDEVKKFLSSDNVKGVRFNYVSYKRVTSGQDIQPKGTSGLHQFNVVVPEDPFVASGGAGDAADAALREFHSILTLKHILQGLDSPAGGISKTAPESDTPIDAATSLAEIREELRTSSPEQIHTVLDSLLNAIYELKTDLAQALEVKKLEGKLLANSDPVKRELDDLTADVITRLVKEEYLAGTVTPKRLARVIRRMIPELSELKRFLPRMKATLVGAGMTLYDYMQLIRELDVELESEQLGRLLGEASDGTGLSIAELAEGIRTDPGDAAKLIVLASEIRRGAAGSDDQLSNVLTEYIDKLSAQITVNSRETTPVEGAKMLKSFVARVEGQILDQMKSFGIEQTLLDKVRTTLSSRVTSSFDHVAAKWMASMVSSSREVPLNDISTMLRSFIDQDSHIAQMHDSLTKTLADKGYSPEQIEELFAGAAASKNSASSPEPSQGILSANNTLYFLNRENKQRLRYNSTFSVLMVTISKIQGGSFERSPEPKESAELFPALVTQIRGALRDLDLIGNLGQRLDNAIIIILPMTGLPGAENVCGRLHSSLAESAFTLGNDPVTLHTRISKASPATDEAKDLESLLSYLRKCFDSDA